jgi:hypothetical protein
VIGISIRKQAENSQGEVYNQPSDEDSNEEPFSG